MPHCDECPREREPRSLARWVLAPTCAVALALLATACGSSTKAGQQAPADNGVASGTAQEILNASVAAAKQADSVTVHADTKVTRSASLQLDMRLTRDAGAGKVVALGNEFQLVRVGGSLYVKAPAAFYRRLGVAKTPPAGTWLKLPASTALSQFADLAGTATRLLSTSGSVTKGALTTLDGEPVIELKTTGNLYTGRLYVKTTGEPYPVKLTKQGRETARISFSGWNATGQPVAPSASVTAG